MSGRKDPNPINAVIEKTKSAYLRPEGAATYISVTRSTIYRHIEEGRLRSYLVGGTRLIKISDLDKLVEAGADDRRTRHNMVIPTVTCATL